MRFLKIAIVLLSLVAAVQAEDKVCPADKAAKAGYSAFEAFHKVVAPCWHQAYPDKNYDSLIAAGPGFEKAMAGIAALEPKMKNVARKGAFLMNREILAKCVKRYAAFAKEGQKDSVYAILPQLHEAFENCAGAYLPISYPEVEGIITTIDVILDTHIPKQNAEGIAGSTETLVTKTKALTTATLPESLKANEKQIVPEFVSFQAMAGQLQEASTKKDLAKVKQLASDLKAKLNAFQEAYL